ncbi:MAG TPA: hypothetical protein VFR81_21845, partial [Longimicrobium sp.]|nr:hypothetical protein [Longimicrobium sp.]
MIPRSAILLASLLCLPSLAAAQAPAGPLAAPALPQLAAPAIAPGGWSADAAPRTLVMEAQEDLPKSHLFYSIPLSALMGVAGTVLGYGSGLVLLNCQDESSNCETGPDNAEYGLAALGLAVGSSAGAHFGGLRATSKGDRWLTFAAAAAGALPMIIGSASDNDGL